MASQRISTKNLPLAPRDDSVSDVYHDVKVADPYRQLEDADHQVTADFVSRINQFSRPKLESAPLRQKLDKKINEIYDYRRVHSAHQIGDKVYFFANDGKENQDKMLVRVGNENKVFLDVNAFSADGTTSLNSYEWCHPCENNILAYSLSRNGSDVCGVKLRREDGTELSDSIEGTRHGHVSWMKENQGFFYTMYQSESLDKVAPPSTCKKISTTQLENHSLYYHALGTSQCDDVLVYHLPENPKHHVSLSVSHCGEYIILYNSRGCDPTNRLFVQKVDKSQHVKEVFKPRPVADKFDYKITFIGNRGSRLYFKTDKDEALNSKILTWDFTESGPVDFKELIPESKTRIMRGAYLIKHGLVVSYLENMRTLIVLYDENTGEEKLRIFDGIATVTTTSHEEDKNYIYFGKVSFTRPMALYKVTIDDNAGKLEAKWELFDQSGTEAHNFDDKVTVTDGWTTSADGAKVHYYLLRGKDAVAEGNPRPALVYGYGGFQISLLPGYSVLRLMFIQNLGGAFAFTNLRGGCEFGEKWHREGCLKQKENVFNDMEAIVDQLVNDGVTKHELVTLHGGSNGGLLVAACAQRFPKKLGAIICEVGVLDMIRYPLFTVGSAWVTEYGDPQVKEDFEVLMRYSPLHNLQKVDVSRFPATMVLTADHDDRVVPGHSIKYLAELYHQAQKVDESNLLIGRIEEKAGHGAGKPTHKQIAHHIDIYSFLTSVFNLSWRE